MNTLNTNDTKLVKILADVTKKNVYCGITIFIFIVLIVIYVISAFAIPFTFIEL